MNVLVVQCTSLNIVIYWNLRQPIDHPMTTGDQTNRVLVRGWESLLDFYDISLY